MIIVRVMGGLGNQLQQYALYKKLESVGKDVRLDTFWFRNESFQAGMAAKRELELGSFEGIRYLEASEEEIRSLLGRLWEEKEGLGEKIKRRFLPSAYPVLIENDMYYEKLTSFTDKYLVGYWACEKYYADVLDVLRQEIGFPKCKDDALQKKNEKAIERMEESVSVSVHIRRGDYLDDVNRALFGNICKETYYESAIAYIRERFPAAKFYLFSDDIPYVRERYQGEEYEVIDWNKQENSFYDMMLMSHCRHNICANSTFSFWGARLNRHTDKIMIRPSIHKNTQVCIPAQMKELWAGWTLITPQGNDL